MVSIEKYREYNPDTEAIIPGKSGDLYVVDRYGVNDYGAWRTDADHLYDETYGCSVRGTLETIMHELMGNI